MDKNPCENPAFSLLRKWANCPAANEMRLGKYQHSKSGKFYNVIGVAKHSETLEELVVYEALYDNPESKLWVRPKDMFLEEVELKGKKVPRFVFVGS